MKIELSQMDKELYKESTARYLAAQLNGEVIYSWSWDDVYEFLEAQGYHCVDGEWLPKGDDTGLAPTW